MCDRKRCNLMKSIYIGLMQFILVLFVLVPAARAGHSVCVFDGKVELPEYLMLSDILIKRANGDAYPQIIFIRDRVTEGPITSLSISRDGGRDKHNRSVGFDDVVLRKKTKDIELTVLHRGRITSVEDTSYTLHMRGSGFRMLVNTTDYESTMNEILRNYSSDACLTSEKS